MAWPIEWPKLRRFRSPPSLSSLDTTSALNRAEAKMVRLRMPWIPLKRDRSGVFSVLSAAAMASAFSSNSANVSSLEIAAVLG